MVAGKCQLPLLILENSSRIPRSGEARRTSVSQDGHFSFLAPLSSFPSLRLLTRVSLYIYYKGTSEHHLSASLFIVYSCSPSRSSSIPPPPPLPFSCSPSPLERFSSFFGPSLSRPRFLARRSYSDRWAESLDVEEKGLRRRRLVLLLSLPLSFLLLLSLFLSFFLSSLGSVESLPVDRLFPTPLSRARLP